MGWLRGGGSEVQGLGLRFEAQTLDFRAWSSASFFRFRYGQTDGCLLNPRGEKASCHSSVPRYLEAQVTELIDFNNRAMKS